MQSLIAGRADVNAKDSYGSTPRMWASSRGSIECVNALLAAHADAISGMKFRVDALKMAALISANADVNAKTLTGTPHEAATAAGDDESVKALKAAGAKT